MEVAQDRIEIDDVLTVQLQDDPENAVRRGMLRPHVEEHLAVLERVELGLALRPRRVRRDRLENADLLVEQDARIVGRRVAGRRGGHRLARLTMAPAGAVRGAWVCSMCRTPAPGERAASSARKKSLRSGKLW